MVASKHSFKCIVTALWLTAGGSLPAVAQSVTVDDLFDRLKSADATEFAQIQAQIYTEWSKSGSATVDLLLRRGQDALATGDWVTAVDHFTAAIDEDPTFAEAYNGRATALYMLEEIGPSIDDIRETLVLNPRHFGAMSGFAVILEELGRPSEALEVYKQISDLAPAAENVHEAIDRITLELEGQTL